MYIKTLKEELEKTRDDKGMIRNLAFYKGTNDCWSKKELKIMSNFIGTPFCNSSLIHAKFSKDMIFFDDGRKDRFFYNWCDQTHNKNFGNCKLFNYRDVFGENEIFNKRIIRESKRLGRYNLC